MSITRGVLAQSSEPDAHDSEVLDSNPDRIGIWKRLFVRRGENRTTRIKASWSRDENLKQTQPTYDCAKSGNPNRATLLGGEGSHHYAILALSSLVIIETLYFMLSPYFIVYVRLCVLNMYDPSKGHTDNFMH